MCGLLVKYLLERRGQTSGERLPDGGMKSKGRIFLFWNSSPTRQDGEGKPKLTDRLCLCSLPRQMSLHQICNVVFCTRNKKHWSQGKNLCLSFRKLKYSILYLEKYFRTQIVLETECYLLFFLNHVLLISPPDKNKISCWVFAVLIRICGESFGNVINVTVSDATSKILLIISRMNRLLEVRTQTLNLNKYIFNSPETDWYL